MDENIREIIDERLKQLGEITREFETYQSVAEYEIERIRSQYSEKLAEYKTQIDGLDKDIKSLARKNKAEVFDGKDQVNLEHGILLWGKEKKVSIPRDALDRIEAQGWTEAVKIAKSVDRAVVEKWPVERLTVIGAERKTVEKFSYEIKTDEK
jgi:phage host-nuclease inhibitor protein Gam